MSPEQEASCAVVGMSGVTAALGRGVGELLHPSQQGSDSRYSRLGGEKGEWRWHQGSISTCCEVSAEQ